MEMTITNRKYFKPYDDSDNECCWQLDVIGPDIERTLVDRNIAYDAMYEDWGLGIIWRDGRIEYSLMVTCVDVEIARYYLQYEAFEKRYFILRKLVCVEDTPCGDLISRLAALDEDGGVAW